MENQIILINLVPSLSTPAVARVSQYDVGRPLVFKVYDGTSPADLTGVTAVIEGTKKSGLGFSESGTVTDNTVTLNTTLGMTQEDGSIPAEIRFSKTGEDVGTANFILAVEKSPHLDGTTDGTTETMADLQAQINILNNGALRIKELGNITNANDMENGVYAINTDMLQNVANLPNTSRGIIIVSYNPNANSAFQTAYDFAYDNKSLKYWSRKKSSGTWGEWIIGDQSSYTLSTLITDSSADANDFEIGSVYYTTGLGSQIQNLPFTRIAGIVKTFRSAVTYNRAIQTFESWANDFCGVYAIRNNQGNGWSDWCIVRDKQPNKSFGFTVITDSLGSGYTVHEDNETRKDFYELSWGAFLGRKVNCSYYISGAGGQSTTQWLESTSYGYLGLFQRLPKTPIYFITLGTNDANQNIEEATFKQNYRDIIAAVKAKQPNAIIFCMKIWRTSQPFATYEGYLESVLSEYTVNDNVFVLDINSAVNSQPITNHLYKGHYSSIGYALIADAVYDECINIMNAHPEKFRTKFNMMIGEDVHPTDGYPYPY
ncbi:MAG: BppU family phage baseplate upper protein [Aeriscardovia sp.]|nr:BppU family phage baseplate upper protein [Aeriscardovia sp.]